MSEMYEMKQVTTSIIYPNRYLYVRAEPPICAVCGKRGFHCHEYVNGEPVKWLETETYCVICDGETKLSLQPYGPICQSCIDALSYQKIEPKKKRFHPIPILIGALVGAIAWLIVFWFFY